MKKLGKLSINPEKVMKNEELVSLRGGYGGNELCCTAFYTTQGNVHYCNESETVMQAWVAFWSVFYYVECHYEYSYT